ncbi:hypothetical protein [Halosimplex salinum]|uniref:hypothetical protein n=1 Tax=Halosimplex salinum TaxID=1710538 RepID=UPI001F192F3E|nr:hypothetical protein [Halosimplex salinum]
MPETADGGRGGLLADVRGALTRTRTAATLPLHRRDAALVFAATSAAYLTVYLYALGHLAPGLGGFGVTVVDGAAEKFFRPALGPLSFTPVARVSLGPLTYLFSANTVLGAGVAGLVGLNLALTYLAWTQPASCGIGRPSAGVLAGLPALLSGTACCGPVVLIAVGVQASGVLLTTFQFLLPLAVLLLLAGLVLVGRQVDPAAV